MHPSEADLLAPGRIFVRRLQHGIEVIRRETRVCRSGTPVFTVRTPYVVMCTSVKRFSLLLFLSIIATLPVVAQSAGDEEILDLALQALSYPGAPPGDVALYPGTLPDTFTVPFAMPEGARLLGSLVRPYETTIFIRTSADAEEVAQFYYDHFRQAGWQTQTWPRWGFASAAEAFPNLYCSPTESRWVNVMSSNLPDKPTDVRLTINGVAGERSPCENEQTIERPPDMPPMPLLTLPSDARMTSIGSGSGIMSMDEIHGSASFRTDESVSELMQHFASQLEQSGWQQVQEGADETTAWRTYTVRDAQDRAWQGQFLLTRLPDQDRVTAFVLASKVI